MALIGSGCSIAAILLWVLSDQNWICESREEPRRVEQSLVNVRQVRGDLEPFNVARQLSTTRSHILIMPSSAEVKRRVFWGWNRTCRTIPRWPVKVSTSALAWLSMILTLPSLQPNSLPPYLQRDKRLLSRMQVTQLMIFVFWMQPHIWACFRRPNS